MFGLSKSKLTALAMGLSFIFIGVQGDYTKANSVDDTAYMWPVPDSKAICEYYSETNNGIDIISEKEDTEVVAARGGKVTAARSTDCPHVDNYPEYCCNRGLGNYVRIEHEDGTYALYENLKYGSVTVTEGQMVDEGTVIGIMGSSGRSQKVHLHFVLAYTATKTINVNPDALSYKYPVEKSAQTVVEQNLNTWKINNDDGVNFRSDAGLSNDIVGYIPAGTELQVTEQNEADGYTWGKAEYNGITGWCVLDYAQKIVKNVYVKEAKENCLLKLETYGGKLEFNTYICEKGSEFGNQQIPVKEGCTFEGWYTDEKFTTELNPKYTINEDTTLYAKWSQSTVEGQGK